MAISEEKSRHIADTRRKQILDAAILLFDQQGYTNTKISDISERAGISKGLVYRYFKSKEDILYALQDYITECIDECAEMKPAIKGIRVFGLRLLSYPYYEEVPPIRVFFSAIVRNEIKMSDEENPISENFGSEYFGKLFKRAQEEGDIKDCDPQMLGNAYWKYLLGSLSLLCQQDAIKENHPDMNEFLHFFLN